MKKPGTTLTNKINIDGCTDHGDDNKATYWATNCAFIVITMVCTPINIYFIY